VTSRLYQHLSQDRYDSRSQGTEPGLRFDREYGFWYTSDPDDIVALLRRADLETPNLRKLLDRIASQLGIHFPTLSEVSDCVPLALNGAVHQAARGKLQNHLLSSYKREDVEDLIKVEVSKWAELPSGQIDLMNGFIYPLAKIVAINILSIPAHVSDLAFGLTDIFDRYQGPSAWRRLEEQFVSLRSAYLQAGVSEDDVTFFLAGLTAGADPLAGMLSDGLYRLMATSDGARPCDWSLDDFPMATGVPVTERVATADFGYHGCQIAKDDILRLYFQPMAYNEEEQTRHYMFGSGVHACLGRHIAVHIWKELIARLRQDKRKIEIRDFALRRSRLFIIPDRFVVEISS
jgi:cytochrome P450